MATLCRTANCLRTKTTITTAILKLNSTVLKKSIYLPFAGRVSAVATIGMFINGTNSKGSIDFNLHSSKRGKDSILNVKSQQIYQQQRNFSSLQIPLQFQPTKLVHHSAMAPLKNSRYISSKEITKNMTLYTNGICKDEVDQKTLAFKKPTGNPLVLMMAWLMAKQKHLKKYAEIYTDLGFDVVVVHITPWQLLWPVKGTQVVAAETIKFLENNRSYAPIVVHGFSVGAYQFGEIMLQMASDMERYSQILDRFVCQIWDSAADITEIPVGLPKSIFPRNISMQSALRNYTLYHLKTFHNQATVHYMRSSQMFHSTILKRPALFFVSENDLIGPPASNNAVRENWERSNIKVTFKCWQKSVHASHLMKHRDEYLEYLFKHLEESGALESVRLKSRAKL